MKKVDVIIIGAGASGLMCAIEAGKRGRQVVVLDHANKVGKKILMSGGGRCNFTNYMIEADHFISNNFHFCKSALQRFTQWDFIAMVEKHRIAYHEREHGQLFCNDSAKEIRDMLVQEAEQVGVDIQLNNKITKIEKKSDHYYSINSTRGDYSCQALVVASGGLSIPKMGASAFGYKIAEQFGLKVLPTRAGLVPLTLHAKDKKQLVPLSGIAVDAIVSHTQRDFRENILFTHRGLSGPAVLQISSYWLPGENVDINLLPDVNLLDIIKEAKHKNPKVLLKTVLKEYLPKRLLAARIEQGLLDSPLQHISYDICEKISMQLHHWRIKPNGTEGYRTAEVTLGGVDCNEISSKTMESKNNSGLYFIGEVLDVTGWLGGYNFQWAWASGWCAGQYV